MKRHKVTRKTKSGKTVTYMRGEEETSASQKTAKWVRDSKAQKKRGEGYGMEVSKKKKSCN